MCNYTLPTFSTAFTGLDSPAGFVASGLLALDVPGGFGVSALPGFDSHAGLGVFAKTFVMRRSYPVDPPGVSKASCTSSYLAYLRPWQYDRQAFRLLDALHFILITLTITAFTALKM